MLTGAIVLALGNRNLSESHWMHWILPIERLSILCPASWLSNVHVAIYDVLEMERVSVDTLGVHANETWIEALLRATEALASTLRMCFVGAEAFNHILCEELWSMPSSLNSLRDSTKGMLALMKSMFLSFSEWFEQCIFVAATNANSFIRLPTRDCSSFYVHVQDGRSNSISFHGRFELVLAKRFAIRQIVLALAMLSAWKFSESNLLWNFLSGLSISRCLLRFLLHRCDAGKNEGCATVRILVNMLGNSLKHAISPCAFWLR